MQAIEITQTGGPDVLNYVELPRPVPGPGEVLIKAEAIGVNFIDTYFRTGMYPHPLPFIVGSEVCGIVAEIGPGVTTAQVGWSAPTRPGHTLNIVLPQWICLLGCRTA